MRVDCSLSMNRAVLFSFARQYLTSLSYYSQKDPSSARYPRRGRKAAPGSFSGQDDEAENPGDGDVHFSDEGDNESDDLEDDDEEESVSRQSRKRPGEKEGSRRSKRSTKFASSMAEPTGISDLLAPRDVNKSPRRKRRNHTKSVITSPESDEEDERYKPKKKSRRGKQLRDSLAEMSDDAGDEIAESDEEEYTDAPKAAVSADSDESGDEEGGDEDEPLKIQRIIGCKSERRSTWKEVCAKMNTSEITYGSMWDQKDRESEDQEAFEERFLVKWNGLSYLHCSWETQTDLEEQTDNAKAYLATFFRKSTQGYLFSPEERNDGDYFDPGFTQMERVLDVDYPDGFDATTAEQEDTLGPDAFEMVHDPSKEGFEDRVGRMIMVKWMSLPYSECSWEYERDLIINEVEYKQHLKAHLTRITKPKKKDRRARAKEMDPKKRLLYKIFGENSPTGEDSRNKGVEQYQNKLKSHVFKNGGQLRDYQAEGVSWMISNYINERSCILADEVCGGHFSSLDRLRSTSS